MQGAYLIGGGKFHIKKYKVAASFLNGIVVLRPAANATGVSTSTTTSFADAMGLTLDPGHFQGSLIAYSTTQGDPEPVSSVIVNPDLVLRGRLVGSATSAVMTNNAVTTAASNGLTATSTTGIDFTSPSCDEGTIWYTSGANANSSRKVTGEAATVITVVVPFAGNAVGDIFLAMGLGIGQPDMTLTTDLLDVRADITNTGADVEVIDHELNGNSNSYSHMVVGDHMFAGQVT